MRNKTDKHDAARTMAIEIRKGQMHVVGSYVRLED
jgi:hypothetical protein